MLTRLISIVSKPFEIAVVVDVNVVVFVPQKLNQSNHNHKYNDNSMGFDTIEINLVRLCSY